MFEYTEDDIALQTEYLKKIVRLCQDKGIELETFIAPAASYVSEEDKKLIPDDVRLIDFNDGYDMIGLDLKRDFYDARHLNLYGAVKFTKVFSEYIKENFSFDGQNTDLTLWQKRLDNLNRLS